MVNIRCLVSHISTDSYGEFSIAKFLICPFGYDADKNSLSYTPSIDFYFSKVGKEKSAYSAEYKLSDFDYPMIEMMQRTVVNPEDIPESNSMKITDSADYQFKLSSPQKIDPFQKTGYLIITNDALSYNFMRLLNWKRQKGVNPTYLVTTSEIDSNYPGENLQIKIKECIYDYYKNMRVKYVLLGGDDTVIPTMYCYTKVETNAGVDGECHDMPSDLFYACLDRSNFNWDANQNGIRKTIHQRNYWMFAVSHFRRNHYLI